MRSNIRFILVIALIAIAFLVVILSVHGRQTEWEQHRQVITVVVCYGDTLYDFALEYKPSWMDAREYIYQVQQLNDMNSSTIYVGQTIKLYIAEE